MARRKPTPFQDVEFSILNWLCGQHLQNHFATIFPYDQGPCQPVTLARFEAFNSYLISLGVQVLPALEECRRRGWTHDMALKVMMTEDGQDGPMAMPARVLGLDLGMHRVVGIAPQVHEALASLTQQRQRQKQRVAQTEPTASLLRLQAAGQSISQVLAYLKTPAGKQLLELCQQQLAKQPKVRGSAGRRRTLKDVIKAAYAAEFYTHVASIFLCIHT